MKTAIAPVERVLSRVVPADGGCVVYVGALNRHGYGSIKISKRPVRTAQVHRLVYQELVGQIPEGMELDHICSNRACVRPSHLEPVMHAENVRRSAGRGLMGRSNAGKTHCAVGHPYDESNTYHRPEGGRNCRQCQLDSYHRHKIIGLKARGLPKAVEAAAIARRARTHCPHGHEFSPENTRIDANGARKVKHGGDEWQQ